VRRLALAAAAALALAGAAGQAAAEAAPQRVGEPAARRAAIAAPQRADEAAPQPAANAAPQRAANAAPQRRRGAERPQRGRGGRRSRPVLRGSVRSHLAGLPPGFAAAPGVSAPAPDAAPDMSAPPDEGAPPPPPPPAPPAGSGRSVQARSDDRDPDHLKLILSRTTVLAGDVKIEFNNAFAEDPHDLLVERVGGSGAGYAFPELGPGEVERRTVALDAGEWRLRCTIPTHAERGMTAALTVTG
jgi:hypothetical protein